MPPRPEAQAIGITMRFLDSFGKLKLDVVGIIAVLGEASVTRNAQVSALSWYRFASLILGLIIITDVKIHSVIPRLLPAPQALLEHERKQRLPVQAGTVVGAYSGNVKHELNFFAQILHHRPLAKFEVELVEVKRRPGSIGARSYGAKPYAWLFSVSMLGAAMSTALLVLSVIWNDGFALLATLLLSAVASVVGIGTHWTLVFREPEFFVKRQDVLPRSDVVIYYPHGAIRVIRCEEAISRLYFETEMCHYTLDDTPYRTVASLATVMLMAAVISLANATNILQVAFAAAYLILNFLYWICSAFNPFSRHWDKAYEVSPLAFAPLHAEISKDTGATKLSRVRSKTFHTFVQKTKSILQRVHHSWQFRNIMRNPNHLQEFERIKPVPEEVRNFTAALWTAIALTQTTQWLNEGTHIAPVNAAWKRWIEAAEKEVQVMGTERQEHYEIRHAPKLRTNVIPPRRRIKLPPWDYQQALTNILKEETAATQKTLAGDKEDIGFVSQVVVRPRRKSVGIPDATQV